MVGLWGDRGDRAVIWAVWGTGVAEGDLVVEKETDGVWRENRWGAGVGIWRIIRVVGG